jgi:5-methylthioadenosine/S-adenosylhomocysteine deaminase
LVSLSYHSPVLLVLGDVVLTMDPDRRMVADGAVLVDGDRIVAVGSAADLTARAPDAERLGGPGHLVLPGLINAHQHLTGDRLVRSTIPDDIEAWDAILRWAVPIHAAHTGDDDQLSATLGLVEAVTNGITFTVEAGTVAHPDRVLAGYDEVGVGGTLGSWGWDVPEAPFAGTVDEVLDRQRFVLDVARGHPRVHGWVTLVGHDLMSDELVARASALAREAGTRMTFHLSPGDNDAVAYLARTGRRPAVHLDELGVLGDHVLLAHAVHLDDAEVDVMLRREVGIAYCPWAYLRLGQGVARAGRHAEIVAAGGRVALGCDAENAGDHVDVLRAAQAAAGIALDAGRAPFGAHTALELATIAGARAIGMDHELGSLEAGKRADVVVIDTSGPNWVTRSPDPALQLLWASDGRDVRHVVASGRVVVSDGECTTVDLPTLAAEAQIRQRTILAEVGLDPRPRWPFTRSGKDPLRPGLGS